RLSAAELPEGSVDWTPCPHIVPETVLMSVDNLVSCAPPPHDPTHHPPGTQSRHARTPAPPGSVPPVCNRCGRASGGPAGPDPPHVVRRLVGAPGRLLTRARGRSPCRAPAGPHCAHARHDPPGHRGRL